MIACQGKLCIVFLFLEDEVLQIRLFQARISESKPIIEDPESDS
jgi:hypothetical protein